MQTLEIPSKNLMKAKMASGELAVGMIVRLMRGVEIAAIARSAGFDCLYIDLEHCSFSLETVSQICLTATALGCNADGARARHQQSRYQPDA